jgi:hypothetical protein
MRNLIVPGSLVAENDGVEGGGIGIISCFVVCPFDCRLFVCRLLFCTYST